MDLYTAQSMEGREKEAVHESCLASTDTCFEAMAGKLVLEHPFNRKLWKRFESPWKIHNHRLTNFCVGPVTLKYFISRFSSCHFVSEPLECCSIYSVLKYLRAWKKKRENVAQNRRHIPPSRDQISTEREKPGEQNLFFNFFIYKFLSIFY